MRNTRTEKTIGFTHYPNLQLGFTTANFAQCINFSVESAKILIDYAWEEGYAFIELRDEDARLHVEDCREITAYAKEKQIEVLYATGLILLADNFTKLAQKGIQNVAAFNWRFVRAADGTQAFFDNPHKTCWTTEEFRQAVDLHNQMAHLAKDHGAQYVIENVILPVTGEYGLEHLFEAVHDDVHWQIDTGNWFVETRTSTDHRDAKAFLRKYADRAHYAHLKSSMRGKIQPVLTENELDFEEIFPILSAHNINRVAIELAPVAHDNAVKVNHMKSIDYLQKKGVLTVRVPKSRKEVL